MRRTATAVLSTMIVVLCSSAALAVTHVVDGTGGGEYLTVQEGVDAAANGDTVLVMPGMYWAPVVVDGKCLTFEGQGPSVTQIFWDGLEPTMEFLNTPSPLESRIENISVAHSFDLRQVHTVVWSGSTVVFDGAVIGGGAIGEGDPFASPPTVHTGIEAYGSMFDWIIVTGDRACTIQGCTVSTQAVLSGWYEDAMTMGELPVTSSGSSYEYLEIAGLCSFDSSGDTAGEMWIFGGLATSSTVVIDGGDLGAVVMRYDNDVTLTNCVIEDVSRHWSEYPGFPLRMTGCLVTDEVDMFGDAAGCRLIHNTFLGWFYYEAEDASPYSAIRSNIFDWYTTIVGPMDNSNLAITHNDFAYEPWTHVGAGPDSFFANIWYEDPRFCGPEYTIEDCSPCVLAAHDGGDIGAFGVDCDCTLPSAVETMSWGRIKGLYR